MIQKRKLFACLSFIIAVVSCRQVATADIAIENTNIIDVQTGHIVAGRDVFIKGNKITDVTPHGQFSIQSPQIINGADQYMIPGLWDMHEHMMREQWFISQMPLLRANGITGFREMWGDAAIAHDVQRMIDAERLPFFRFVAAGHILDGKKPFWPGAIAVATPAAAVKSVDSLKNTGAPFIKVYSYLAPDVFAAIARHCKEINIPFAGHVPHTVSLTTAAAAGMASMEHLYGFLTEASANSDSAMALMQQMVAARDKGNMAERKKLSMLYLSYVINSFSKDSMTKVARKLKENNTRIVPTLAMLRGEYFTNDSTFTSDPRLKYMSPATLDYWTSATKKDLASNTPTDWQNKRARWQVEQQIMRILISEKVPIMAGTDADNPYVFPGFSLHDELSMYVSLGMTPLEALRSATIVPLQFLDMTDSLGAISKGKLADMVLLGANPLNNIKNTTLVKAVIANGRLYSKHYIDSVLKR